MLLRRTILALAGTAVVAGCASKAGTSSAQATAQQLVRVNQVGYSADQPKTARLLSAGPRRGARFTVTMSGKKVLSGRVGRDLGAWNGTFRHVYAIDVSALRAPGRYVVTVAGHPVARSPVFRVDTAQALYAPLVARELAYLRAQRDGADVDSSIFGRRPSHLADQSAMLYNTPTYRKGLLVGGLHQVGGPVDVSGGWMDAGDTLKYAETTSFTSVLLNEALIYDSAGFGGAMDLGRQEARHGLDWLLKLWDPASSRLVYQVGLGQGNDRNILGAHDTSWRRPEVDDTLKANPGSSDHYVKYRPAFVTGPEISPNLAGRIAAAYATGAQVFASSDPAYSARLLDAAQSIFARAKTKNVGQLVTAAPHAFYPELEWRDDMELGAIAIADALNATGQPGANAYVSRADHWADAYASSPLNGTDSLNLYDVAALAHPRLLADLRAEGADAPTLVTQRSLAMDLHSQLRVRSGRDPFGLAWSYRDDDTVAHALGAAIEGRIAAALGVKGNPARLATTNRDFVLGDNAWGTSFVVGAGTLFPHCLHDPLANLAGSLNGTAPVMLGAVVPGPVDATELTGLQLPKGYRACPSRGRDPFASFTGFSARYADRVAFSPTVEPSIDLAGLAIVAFASQASG